MRSLLRPVTFSMKRASEKIPELSIAVQSCRANQDISHVKKENGAPERIRTSDPQIRSLVLYPAELRVHRRRRSVSPQQRCGIESSTELQAGFTPILQVCCDQAQLNLKHHHFGAIGNPLEQVDDVLIHQADATG